MSVPADDPDGWAFGNGGFAKLYGDRLAQSSLLELDVATRWAFIYILSQADAEGRYRCASVAGLARAAALTLEQATKAVAELEAPDQDSTSPLDEGRRLLRISGGWQVVTYKRYREYQTPRQLAEAEKKRKQREALKKRMAELERKAGDAGDMSRSVPGTPAPEDRGQTSDDRGTEQRNAGMPECGNASAGADSSISDQRSVPVQDLDHG